MKTEAAVKERPIVFSAAMLGAIRAGLKTQTRRVVMIEPGAARAERLFAESAVWRFHWPGREGRTRDVSCPFGSEGDRLWVRETLLRSGEFATYAADGAPVVLADGSRLRWRWRDSGLSCRFMPREASRLEMRIEEVRCPRLQAISIADVFAEGLRPADRLEARWRFEASWDELHREGSWREDPWVWALTFGDLTIR